MIQINQLDFTYKGKDKLFKNLDARFEKGNIYGILGENGMGKSSLLKLIAGLVFPQKGAVLCDGMKVAKRSPDLLQKIFFLNEDFHLPSLNIAQYIRAYSPFYQAFDHEIINTILSEFGIDNSQHLHQLSLGQKKKFLIAFGLATNAEYLLMDEPTNGLDIPSKSDFRRLIASQITDEQVLLICTHQIRDLANLLDHIVVMADGEILLAKSIAEIEEKLLFRRTSVLQDGNDVIYSEIVPGGYLQVCENPFGQNSHLELEVLFNAVVKNRQAILNYLKT